MPAKLGYGLLWFLAYLLIGGCKGSLSSEAEATAGRNAAVGGESAPNAPRAGRGGSSSDDASAGAGDDGAGASANPGPRSDAGRPEAGARGDAAQAGSGGTARPDSGSAPDAGSAGSGGGSVEPPSYNPCPARGTPCAIMPLGDSIAYGDRSSTLQGWRLELFRSALAHSQSITFVGTRTSGDVTEVDGKPYSNKHEGYPGAQVEGIINSGTTALQTVQPNMILLMAGTNNVWTAQKLDGAPERIADFVDKVNAEHPDVLMVVATVIWQNTDRTAEIAAFNARLTELIEERVAAGKRVYLVDMYTAFASVPMDMRTDLFWDQLHPNDKGYKRMAETWYGAVGSLFR